MSPPVAPPQGSPLDRPAGPLARLQRRLQRRRMRSDEHAAANPIGMMISLILGYMVMVFIVLLLQNSIGADVSTVCDAGEIANGTSTQEECDDAKTARGFVFTALVVAGVAVLIIILGVAVKSTRGFGGR